MTLLIQT